MVLISLFTTFIYQPFFNLLVLIYEGLGFGSKQPDMGTAVILFTVVFRVAILPLSLASGRTEKERRELALKIEELKNTHSNDPIRKKEETRRLFRANPRMIAAEVFDIGLQILVAVMLYRIFTSGIKGSDFHLLYKFIPQPEEGFNLLFLGKYDLTKPSFPVNMVNTIVIFTAEALNIITSPLSWTKEDKMTLFVLPLVAFLFFSQMPAGKKLFITTTLLFTIMLTLVKQAIYMYHNLTGKFAGKTQV